MQWDLAVGIFKIYFDKIKFSRCVFWFSFFSDIRFISWLMMFIFLIASFRSLESRASLIVLSLLTVLTTEFVKYSSEPFYNLTICLISINLFSSFSTLSAMCSGTLRPLCYVGTKNCLNVDFAM